MWCRVCLGASHPKVSTFSSMKFLNHIPNVEKKKKKKLDKYHKEKNSFIISRVISYCKRMSLNISTFKVKAFEGQIFLNELVYMDDAHRNPRIYNFPFPPRKITCLKLNLADFFCQSSPAA